SGRSFPPQVSLSQVSLSQVSLAFFPAFAETGVLTLTSFRFFAGIPEARFGGPFGVKGSGWSASFRVARVGGVGGHGSPASSPPSKPGCYFRDCDSGLLRSDDVAGRQLHRRAHARPAGDAGRLVNRQQVLDRRDDQRV